MKQLNLILNKTNQFNVETTNQPKPQTKCQQVWLSLNDAANKCGTLYLWYLTKQKPTKTNQTNQTKHNRPKQNQSSYYPLPLTPWKLFQFFLLWPPPHELRRAACVTLLEAPPIMSEKGWGKAPVRTGGCSEIPKLSLVWSIYQLQVFDHPCAGAVRYSAARFWVGFR